MKLPLAITTTPSAVQAFVLDCDVSTPQYIVMSFFSMFKEAIHAVSKAELKSLPDATTSAMSSLASIVASKLHAIVMRNLQFCGYTDDDADSKRRWYVEVFLPDRLATFDDIKSAIEV